MAYVERSYLAEQFEMLLHDDNIMNPVVKVLDALEIIDTAPTADVVPKSEVDFLRASQNLHEAEFNEIKAELELRNAEIETLNARLEVFKAEVAREIFEEIEEAIEKCKYNQSTPFGIEERYNPYAFIKQVSKLKKKYTEEKYEN